MNHRDATESDLPAIDRVFRPIEPLIPAFVRKRAIGRAERWFTARLNGTDGLGGIFPAMVNAVLALRPDAVED